MNSFFEEKKMTPKDFKKLRDSGELLQYIGGIAYYMKKIIKDTITNI